jgi:hypothetical protein
MRRFLVFIAALFTFGVGQVVEAKPRAKARVSKKAAKRAAKAKAAPPKAKLPDPVAPEPAAAPQATTTPPSRGPTRIDFDDRLIQGQTNKSGAVYLYDRKELKSRSMVRTRESFREEIVRSVYDS